MINDIVIVLDFDILKLGDLLLFRATFSVLLHIERHKFNLGHLQPELNYTELQTFNVYISHLFIPVNILAVHTVSCLQ